MMGDYFLARLGAGCCGEAEGFIPFRIISISQLGILLILSRRL